MGKLKTLLKKSKEIVNKAKRKKRLTAQQKKDRENIAALTVGAPPLLGATYMSSKTISDEKVRQREKRIKQKEKEKKAARYEKQLNKAKEAAKKKKENKNNKPKKMKAGGIALKGHGKAFLKGNR